MAKPKKSGGKSLAAQADKYDLYQRSVQEPSVEVEFFDRIYRKRNKRAPMVLREDFCGTAAVCCEWVQSHPKRRAIGVDLDPEPIEWCRKHNMARLSDEQRSRVSFVLEDVRKPAEPQADLLAAQNFSFFCFKTRDEVVDYFRAARQNIAPGGLFVLDMMGGSEVHTEDHSDKTKKGKFTYIWEQERFDPITHHCRFHIHFKFKDGSRIRHAFTYDWRLWTLPEVQEMLAEAGFVDVTVYWEDTDNETGEGNGNYRPREHAAADPAWVAYVSGANPE
jgi:SAM-dependent methyltransferase